MKRTMILSYIATSQRRRLIYPFLLLMTAVFLLFRTSIFNYIHMDVLPVDNVISESTARRSLFVKAPVSRLYYTGEDYWSSGQLTGHIYYALQNGICQYYVVKASAGRPASSVLEDHVVTGRIDAFGPELETLNSSMARRLDWVPSELLSVSSRYYINETVYLRRREILLILVLAAVLLAAVFTLGRTLLYWFNPRLTPAYRKLHKYGDAQAILADAEKQLSRQSLIRTRNMVLTGDYLIEFSGDESAIIPLASVLWTYDHASLRYTLHGKTMSYTLHVVTVHGDEYNLKQKSAEDVQVIYHELTNRFPDYFYGYSKEHQQMVRHIIKEMKEED